MPAPLKVPDTAQAPFRDDEKGMHRFMRAARGMTPMGREDFLTHSRTKIAAAKVLLTLVPYTFEDHSKASQQFTTVVHDQR